MENNTVTTSKQDSTVKSRFYAVIDKLNKYGDVARVGYAPLGNEYAMLEWTNDGLPVMVYYTEHYQDGTLYKIENVVPAKGAVVHCRSHNDEYVQKAFVNAGFTAVIDDDSMSVSVMFD